MQPRMTMARTLKLFKLPETTQTPGLRPLTKADIPQVLPLDMAEQPLYQSDICPLPVNITC